MRSFPFPFIVSTMQELAALPDPSRRDQDVLATLQKLDANIRELRAQVLEASGPKAD